MVSCIGGTGLTCVAGVVATGREDAASVPVLSSETEIISWFVAAAAVSTVPPDRQITNVAKN